MEKQISHRETVIKKIISLIQEEFEEDRKNLTITFAKGVLEEALTSIDSDTAMLPLNLITKKYERNLSEYRPQRARDYTQSRVLPEIKIGGLANSEKELANAAQEIYFILSERNILHNEVNEIFEIVMNTKGHAPIDYEKTVKSIEGNLNLPK